VDHIAILRKAKISKADNLLGDILAGTKTIESRWYVNKVSPWNRVGVGDYIYLKESGCPVSAVTQVAKVLQYENLTNEIVHKIIRDFGKQISPGTPEQELLAWSKTQRNKRYCILIFLKNVKRLVPFDINKKGFGISSAWLCVGDINKVKKSKPSQI
jgi:hypothetical protein